MMVAGYESMVSSYEFVVSSYESAESLFGRENLSTDMTEIGNQRLTRAGIFLRRTNRKQDVRVYSYDRPIESRPCGYILTTDQSKAGRAGVFSRRTNGTILPLKWSSPGRQQS
eukprot:7353678-Pyramimonas_sp.AAC.1